MQRSIFTVVGMAFFWGYFRLRDIVGALYVVDLLQPGDSPAFVVYTLTLAVLAVTALALPAVWWRLTKSTPGAVAVSAAASCAGAVALMLRNAPELQLVYFGCSVASAFGFVALALLWASLFSRSFGDRSLLDIALSVLVSFLLAATTAFPSPLKLFFPIAAPLCSGLCWALACRPRSPEKPGAPIRSVGETLHSVLRLDANAWLFVAFLLVGSAIRGFLVDESLSTVRLFSADSRFPLSLALSLTAVASAYIFWRKGRSGSAKGPNRTGGALLLAWNAVALVFFAGLFMGLFPSTADWGVRIVVVARSFFDYLLWALLCNSVRRSAAPVLPAFALFVLGVMVASCGISYFLIPQVVTHFGGGLDAFSQQIALLALFILVALVTSYLAWTNLRRQEAICVVYAREDGSSGAVERLAQQHRLTEREKEVVRLYSEGNSLKKVAEDLFISLHTAQSHIKRAYTKMGVHSKQELIDLVKRS